MILLNFLKILDNHDFNLLFHVIASQICLNYVATNSILMKPVNVQLSDDKILLAYISYGIIGRAGKDDVEDLQTKKIMIPEDNKTRRYQNREGYNTRRCNMKR